MTTVGDVCDTVISGDDVEVELYVSDTVISGVEVEVELDVSDTVISRVDVEVELDVSDAVTSGVDVEVDLCSHPALYAQSHVSKFLFQCKSAGHTLQWATPLLQ